MSITLKDKFNYENHHFSIRFDDEHNFVIKQNKQKTKKKYFFRKLLVY